jgi:hypothetical protein
MEETCCGLFESTGVFIWKLRKVVKMSRIVDFTAKIRIRVLQKTNRYTLGSDRVALVGNTAMEIDQQVSCVTYKRHFETETERIPSPHNLTDRLHK